MTLFKYLDQRYKALSLQRQLEYTTSSDAEMKAVNVLIVCQIWFFKWTSVPTLFAKYILINIGILKEPESFEIKKVEPASNPSDNKEESSAVHVQ